MIINVRKFEKKTKFDFKKLVKFMKLKSLKPLQYH